MTKIKQFTIPDQGDPLLFSLGGQKFRCRGRIASGAILRLGEAVNGTEDSDASVIIKALRNFLKAALLPEDYARFEAMLDDPDIAVPLETVNEIAGWLAGEYTNERPTGQPSQPTSPSDSSGEGSTAGASLTESTSSNSPLTGVSA